MNNRLNINLCVRSINTSSCATFNEGNTKHSFTNPPFIRSHIATLCEQLNMKLTILLTTLALPLVYGQGSTSQWEPAGPNDCMLMKDIHPPSRNANIAQFEALVPWWILWQTMDSSHMTAETLHWKTPFMLWTRHSISTHLLQLSCGNRLSLPTQSLMLHSSHCNRSRFSFTSLCAWLKGSLDCVQGVGSWNYCSRAPRCSELSKTRQCWPLFS